MTNSEKIVRLQNQIVSIKEEMINCKPSRCTAEDIEDVSDNYQSNLEYQWYREEMEAEIAELEVEIARIKLLPSGGQFDENPWSFEEAQNKYYSNAPEGMFYGMDKNGNKGYFEDFEQSIGE